MDVKRMRDLVQLSADELKQLEAAENPNEILPPELNDPIVITDEEAEQLFDSVMKALDQLKEELKESIENTEVL